MGHNTCKSMGGILCVVRRYVNFAEYVPKRLCSSIHSIHRTYITEKCVMFVFWAPTTINIFIDISMHFIWILCKQMLFIPLYTNINNYYSLCRS